MDNHSLTEEVRVIQHNGRSWMVSNRGRAKLLSKRAKSVGFGHASNGYRKVSNGVGIHRLVALAFIPNPENKRCINHKNGIKHDNRSQNIEWATHSENTLHAIRTGLANNPPQNNSGRNGRETAVVGIPKYGPVGYFLPKMESSKQIGIPPTSVSHAVNRDGSSGGYSWKLCPRLDLNQHTPTEVGSSAL